MRRPALALALVLAASTACAPAAAPPPPPEPGAPPPGARLVYACADGFRFEARFDRGDTATVVLPDREARLAPQPAEGGARFAGEGVAYASRAGTARLEADGAAHEGCRAQVAETPWEAARLRGVELRAIGQEPGWLLELDAGGTLRYVGDYGEVRLAGPAPEPVREPARGPVDTLGAATFTLRAAGRELVATVTPAPCADAMSGEPSPYAVTVRLDGRETRGCGRTLATGDLTGVRWRLVEVGGAPAVAAPGPDGPHLRLDAAARRVTGSTGCNRVSGPYTRGDGDALRLGPLATTRRACTDPALDRQERALLRALEATERAEVTGDVLRLRAGDRVLARFAAEVLG